MTPGALAPEGWLDWLRLLGGTLLLLAPGLAAADRLLGLHNRGWWFAPVFSLSLLPLGAIVLDLVLQVRVTPLVTVLLAVGWTVALQGRRIIALRPWRKAPWLALWQTIRAGPVKRRAWAAVAILGVLGFVALVHALPHLPGAPTSIWTAYPDLAVRAADGMQGDDYPYPIHVDEHYHLAQQAAIAQQGSIDIDDPYTGEPPPNPLFSVAGFRQERGFDLAVVQVHQLTGLSLMTQAHFLPVAQVTLLAALLYATLAPARGAWASALLIAILPTTVRFLGPGYLVPSAFALPWVVTALHISLRGQGARRLAALAILETAAFFLHLVLGTLVLVVAALATAARRDPPRDRLVLLAVCFLPLVWIGPLVAEQVTDAVTQEHTLPFQAGILTKVGYGVLALAVAGIVACARGARDEAPHRVLAVLAVSILVSLILSIRLDHHSDATYSRLIPTFFVCLAGLAGLGIGWLGQGVARLARGSWAAVPAGLLVALVALSPALAFQMDAPMYRVFGEESWTDGELLAQHARPGDKFLSDPWRAPVYTALTGARPQAYLVPGNAPVNGTDWDYYLASGGADAAWLTARDITFVVAPVAPRGPFANLGGNVYRLVPT